MNLQKITFSFVLLALVVCVLIYGQALMVPFILALLIWFILKEIRELLQKINWIKRKIPRGVLSTISFILIVGVLSLFSSLLTHNVKALSKALPDYQKEIKNLGSTIESSLGIDLQDSWTQYAGEIDFAAIIQMLINSLSDLVGNAVMILIYLIFLLLEEGIFIKKLRALYPSKEKFEKVSGILSNIDRSIGKYIALKSVVSLITGGLSYIVLIIIGVEAAAFWALLIFILNFIPTVGSLIGTLFPAVFCLLQFGGVQEMFSVLIFVGIIQVLVGNLLEPKLMGNSLNLSALVVIVSLSFWGALWGITGMILSVPITVGVIIVCSAFPQTRNIAILLSEKGKI